MEFNPFNPVVKLCLQGMAKEDSGDPAEARQLFMQAWQAAANDFEKFLAAWYLARQQETDAAKLEWYNTALQLAQSLDDDAVKGAFAALHANMAQCHQSLGDTHSANLHRELAMRPHNPTDGGPFYHGTRADVQVGDMLIAGHMSNYKADLQMNHIYFTALPNGAGLAAALAKGEGRERVYIVAPTDIFEDDPNVTNKKFPGNPTRSYRTQQPLKVTGELTDWTRQTPEDIQKWHDRLAESRGEIIN